MQFGDALYNAVTPPRCTTHHAPKGRKKVAEKKDRKDGKEEAKKLPSY